MKKPVFVAALVFVSSATVPALAEVENGVTVHLYESGRPLSRLCAVVDGQTPNASWNIPELDLRGAEDFQDFDEHFVARVFGELVINEAGNYEFELLSDDGARLVVGTTTVVVHDGKHSASSLEGQMDLAVGTYPFHVEYFQATGRQRLRLRWRTPGAFRFRTIPSANLHTEANQVHVVSPGTKAFACPGGAVSEAGDGKPLEGVHPSFDLLTIRPSDFEPQVGAMAFLPDGRLAVATWDPVGGVYLLDGVTGSDPEAIQVKRFAYGLGEPLGMTVHDGGLYISQKQELIRLLDTDGDDHADVYETVAGGWPGSSNFHEFTFGLEFKDGFFWIANSVAISTGGGTTDPQPAPDRGTLMRVAEDGHWELVSSGLRTPNGMGIGPDGELFGCDNQGSWVPASKIVHYRPGVFYGHHVNPPGRFDDQPLMPAAVWLPHGEVSKSPSELVSIPEGLPYAGQMLVADVTHGGVKRVYMEKVGGEYQGVAFRFTQGLEAGINRLTFGPDGSLYVGGVGHAGNWGYHGTRFGLQRLRPNDQQTFEMAKVESRQDGFEIEFTRPVPAEILRDGSHYLVKQWHYEPTEQYGGPKIEEKTLRVSQTAISPDGTRVFLRIPGLQAGKVVYIRLKDFTDAYGAAPWSTEAWYTLNALAPEAGPSFTPDEEWEGDGGLALGVGVEPPDCAIVLYDGTDTAEWQNRSWRIDEDDGSYVMGRGDNRTVRAFADFRLHLEFFVDDALLTPVDQWDGNSGVFLQDRYEVQIVNSFEKEIADKDEVGAIFKQHDPLENAASPPGNWQAFDIWFEGARFDATQKIENARAKVYLNGILVQDNVELETLTPGAGAADDGAAGPLRLQNHFNLGAKPRFRNIWVCEPDGGDVDPEPTEPGGEQPGGMGDDSPVEGGTGDTEPDAGMGDEGTTGAAPGGANDPGSSDDGQPAASGGAGGGPTGDGQQDAEGGGTCSAAPGAGGPSAGWGMLLSLLGGAWLWRRRLSRR